METKQPTYTKTEHQADKPNEPLLLHEGEIILTQNSITLQGNSEISLVWLPQPHLSFKTNFGSEKSSEIKRLDTKEFVSIQLPNLDKNLTAQGMLVKEILDGWKVIGVQGQLPAMEPIIFGCRDNIKELKLYLTNFWRKMGSVVIKAGNWLCKIKQVEPFYRFPDELQSVEGYAITHVCRLSKIDKTNLDGNELEKMIYALNYFFSFVRGFWCGVAQANGFDASEKPVWGFWGQPDVSKCMDVESWFIPIPNLSALKIAELTENQPPMLPVIEEPNPPDLSPLNLDHTLDTFLRLWSDETYQRAMKTAVRLYIDANIQNDVDKSLILAQVGLDTLSYAKNVTKGSMKKKTFERNPAHENIKLLLDQGKIPYDMSVPSFHRLKLYAQKNAEDSIPLDGIKIITRMRNRIVHPNNRDEASNATPEESWAIRELALHYLELSLLFLFEFRGKYENRMDNSEEETPWS
jgi:hypothetical protein